MPPVGGYTKTTYPRFLQNESSSPDITKLVKSQLNTKWRLVVGDGSSPRYV